MSELLFSRKPEERMNDHERMIRQFDTDIKRLWRLVRTSPEFGLGGAGDGEINPSSSETTSSATSLESESSSKTSESSSTGREWDSSASDNEGSGSDSSGHGSCCKYMWNGSTWIQIEDWTGGFCTCGMPGGPGAYLGQIVTRCCGEGDGGPGGSGPASGGDSCGVCYYRWVYIGEGVWQWQLISDQCGYSGCTCNEPTVDGMFYGQILESNCVYGSCGSCTYVWDGVVDFEWDITADNCGCGRSCPQLNFNGVFHGQTVVRVC